MTAKKPQSNKEVGESVITPRPRYFVPSFGITVETETPEEAAEKAKKLKEEAEAGDDNI